ncbi:single-stranded DNA-binding protein [Tyzzerella sp. OttesenSCG-928-J15]|nr:single-stranded DNA-binding protein [Tyzzerella sp. OttesenSCG-928-J15]
MILQTLNTIEAKGIVSSNMEYSHMARDEDIYEFKLSVPRVGGRATDELPVLISSKALSGANITIGQVVSIKGKIVSYNLKSDTNRRSKLALKVFAGSLNIHNNSGLLIDGYNNVALEGTVCKEPIFRTTPAGKEITDILLAVNHANGESSYLPLICWGSCARFAEHLSVSSKIKISGRFQSRQYEKRYYDGSSEIKTAYEVSVYKLAFLE